MKKITLALMCLFTVGTSFAQQRQQQVKRTCEAMEELEHQKRLDPTLEGRMAEIEAFTQRKITEMEANHQRVSGEIITIPVVVHVLHTNSTNNISDAQILSQITVLNEDFRRTNSDRTNKWPQAADTQIEFAMATVDPSGNATTAITRKRVSSVDWGTKFKSRNAMKSAASGGISPWDTSEYLNMWIVPKMTASDNRSILGFAQFPGGAASTDGLVMIHDAFGSTGELNPSFNLGRTTTHEIGHFFNLRHIWGDSNCGNDQVSDTPTAQTANYGCATGNESCGSEDMVQNYMDYSDDACMNLFTTGQKNRMRAVLVAGGSRRSLALSTKAGAGSNPTPTACTSTINSFPYNEGFESGLGAWKQDTSDSFDWSRGSGTTPSGSTGPSSASAGTYYMFTESSNPNSPTKTAIFNSPCFDLTGVSNAKMKFKYHMYGSSMGTLKLEVQEEGANTWTSVWSKTGDQGNSWKSAEVSLASNKLKVRFHLTTASSYRSDAAIDAISVESESVADTTAPTVPSNVTASNVEQTTATISWTASTDNVAVTGYDVYQGTNKLGSTENTSVNITELTPNTNNTFSIRAKDAAGNESAAGSVTFRTAAVVADACNGGATLTANSGSFADGSRNSNYADNRSCTWLIQPSNGGTVTLNFSSFNTESGYDYVTVYDGTSASATQLGRFSGTSAQTVTSTGNAMFVRFTSDSSVNEDGWSANYTSNVVVADPCDGGATLTANSGSFTDGSGNSNYADNRNCTWLIQPSNGARVTLNFSSFDTESGYDYVTVYDGTSASATQLGRFSGTSAQTVTSTGNAMFVRFTSDSSVNEGGWSANYTSSSSTRKIGNEELKLSVYPNPSTDFIQIRLGSKSNGMAYKIVNTIGKVVKSGKVNSSRINVSDLNTGIYILEVNHGQKSFKTKILKR